MRICAYQVSHWREQYSIRWYQSRSHGVSEVMVCVFQYNVSVPLVSSPMSVSVLACKPLLVSLLTPPPDKLEGNDTYDNIDAVERG